ncbi:membrane protein [Gordonia phage Outis]|nr:membrane protein [Gordonia phage StarStruck]WKW84979.1 membrane protein [Gordonia phage Outis]
MTDFALRFLALLGPLSVYGVVVRLMESKPIETWWPLLVFAIVINVGMAAVVWFRSHRRHPDAELELTLEDPDRRYGTF